VPDQPAPADITVDELPLSRGSKTSLNLQGYRTLADLADVYFPDIYRLISFDQAKTLLKALLDHDVPVKFATPDWDEQAWHGFVDGLVNQGIVTWREVALAVCGELNPPQVGTAIASNKSFQAKFPPRETMRHVMSWFYAQSGKCTICGTRLFLEADHVRSKQDFRDNEEDQV